MAFYNAGYTLFISEAGGQVVEDQGFNVNVAAALRAFLALTAGPEVIDLFAFYAPKCSSDPSGGR